MQTDVWQSHLQTLAQNGISQPGKCLKRHKPATVADEQALYHTSPSFADLLPWAEFIPDSQAMLLDDGKSVAAFFELLPIGTEGRENSWLQKARDAIENAMQDSLDEHEEQPWIVQLYAQDETNWDNYFFTLRHYVHKRAAGSAFTEFYLRFFEHHLRSISKPGGLFHDNAVSRLPWRGKTRRVRMVIYRRVAQNSARRDMSPEQGLKVVCDRLCGGLVNGGISAVRLGAAQIHDWLLRWFNPHPTILGDGPSDRERFYRLTSYPQESEEGEVELASGTDFSQRLFFNQPYSDAQNGLWYFDEKPHRVVITDRLRTPPTIGHLTGETNKGGDAINAVFDQMPEDTIMCMTMIITPQDTLESHLNYLAKKSVGDTLASEQTRQDVQEARAIIGSAHKLYRASMCFYIQGKDTEELNQRDLQLANVLLGAGLQPVREEDEVAPLNSYLRWLPCVYDPDKDSHSWYTQLMFAQHIANLAPIWGRSQGTGHPGITLFNRGGGPVTFDPLNRLDRQMNAHMFIFGPTGSGKSATMNNILNQVAAIYRPRMFIVEAGNSFGLFGDFAKRLGMSVHKVKLAPGSGVSLAPFSDAKRLVEKPETISTLDIDAAEDSDEQHDEQRDILGELEITARLMITGGEEREEARMTRADRSLIRQCIINAARLCMTEHREVLTEDVRNALRTKANDAQLPETRRVRLLEMSEAIDLFCQGVDGEMFNRPGTPWPEADITIVDLATFAREGYNAQLSIAYISLMNTVNNIAERDQYLGIPIINFTDEGHIITKNPLLSPYIVKITKMWRKLNAWYWLATQNLDDLPKAAQPMLSMIEWWLCLSMPPDEVEKIAQFRELNPAQKALMLSARKEAGKYTEGVVLSKSMEALFRVVTPSLYLALAMTEPEEKNERYRLMQEFGIDEFNAAVKMAENIDRKRGIEPLVINNL
ncbi:conjugative transfer ATPase [Saezia sanguinis]|nr:conjugative transfer ATPase [Saezia sanguinis]